MSNAQSFTAKLRATIDGKSFTLLATGDGGRMIVSAGLKHLFHNMYWEAVQKTCPDVAPAGNNRTSVSTSWFLSVSANPPSNFKPDHRRILRMVHLICREAMADGVNFRSDKIFSRDSPVLQVERNILESPQHWDPAIEVSTSSPADKPKRRHPASSEPSGPDPDPSDSDDSDAQTVTKRQRHVVPFVRDVRDREAVDQAIIASIVPAELSLVGLPQSRLLVHEACTAEEFFDRFRALHLEIAKHHKELALLKKDEDHYDLDAEARRARDDAAAEAQRKREDAAAEAQRKREDAAAEAQRLRDEKDAEVQRQLTQERERMKIDHESKKLAMELKASFKQDAKKMRKKSEQPRFTDQLAQIVEHWEANFAFSHGAWDEMVVCTAHVDPSNFHCMSMFDALAFDTELGEPDETRRDHMAPGCPEGLKVLGIVGGVVLTRYRGLRNELFHYYSELSGGTEGLLRTRLPCNVTGAAKLACSMEWDHIVAVAEGGEDKSDNLHLISSGINAAVGDMNTAEWALANGYGTLKIKPPTTADLAACLQKKWWNGRKSSAETELRLARSSIEILGPWPGVLGAMERQTKRTGQSVLSFPSQTVVKVAAVPVPAQPAISPSCHHKSCDVVVKDATGATIANVGIRSGRSVYCAPHAAQHSLKLQRNCARRRARREAASVQEE